MDLIDYLKLTVERDASDLHIAVGRPPIIRVDGTLQDGYGYQWWVADRNLAMALGYSGQYIIVDSKRNLVVVFTSHLPEPEFYLPQRLFERYIQPAVSGSRPLPENSDGSALLNSYVDELAQP